MNFSVYVIYFHLLQFKEVREGGQEIVTYICKSFNVLVPYMRNKIYQIILRIPGAEDYFKYPTTK